MLSIHSKLLEKLSGDHKKNIFISQTLQIVSEMQELELRYENITKNWIHEKSGLILHSLLEDDLKNVMNVVIKMIYLRK